MRNDDLPQFAALLADVLAGYGKPLPEAAEIGIWFKQLAPFPAATIKRAFEAYRMERPDFAPAPNGIVARARLMDGRPDENEAWAVALTSQDEAETVVWTDEMAAAFNLARPLLETGDEIGARMAFKDAYKRLVGEARAANKPANWNVSAGWDAQRRQIAVQKATVAGLLAGPQPHLALPNETDLPPARPEGLQKLKETLAQLNCMSAQASAEYDARIAEEQAAERARREEIDNKVRAYLAQHPEARYGQMPMPRSEP
ncbi:hypothetical protein [Massilia oculi]|uniref:hypothetical protein n=1 Tax=Massilia oculi TaxID=945844 RepID=UPI001AAE93DF|nr:hypothetical protein [Massilia oculi]